MQILHPSRCTGTIMRQIYIYIGECVCVCVCVCILPSIIHVASVVRSEPNFGTHMQIHLEKVGGQNKHLPRVT